MCGGWQRSSPAVCIATRRHDERRIFAECQRIIVRNAAQSEVDCEPVRTVDASALGGCVIAEPTDRIDANDGDNMKDLPDDVFRS